MEKLVGQVSENEKNDMIDICEVKVALDNLEKIVGKDEAELLEQITRERDITNEINIVISIVFLINISPLLTAVAILLLPFSYLINYVFRNEISSLKKIQKEVEDENYSLINCILNNCILNI